MSEWISVKDGFPKLGTKVLAHEQNGNIQTVNVVHVSSDGNSWRIQYWNFHGANIIVTHWMPLPDPPQEESND